MTMPLRARDALAALLSLGTLAACTDRGPVVADLPNATPDQAAAGTATLRLALPEGVGAALVTLDGAEVDSARAAGATVEVMHGDRHGAHQLLLVAPAGRALAPDTEVALWTRDGRVRATLAQATAAGSLSQLAEPRLSAARLAVTR